MAAKSSGRSGSSGRNDLCGKVQSGLFGHVEVRVPVDELELTDDPARAGHRDVHNVGRTDRSYRPWSAERPVVDGDGVVDRPREVALRADAHVVHRDRLRAGVTQLVDEVREGTLVEAAVDAYRDAGAGHRALTAEHPQLGDLAFGLGKRALPARHRILRVGDIAANVEDLITELVVRLGEIRDQRCE